MKQLSTEKLNYIYTINFCNYNLEDIKQYISIFSTCHKIHSQLMVDLSDFVSCSKQIHTYIPGWEGSGFTLTDALLILITIY